MFKKVNEEEILHWIQSKKWEAFGKYLVSGSVHGKPGLPLAELGRIERIVSKNFSDEEIFSIGKKLLARTEYTAQNLGVGFIEYGWPKHKEIVELIYQVANHDDWIVREYAAGSFARLLEKDFKYFSKLYLKWVKTGSENIQRAIALAVKYHSKSQDKKNWKVYLQLIEPLLKVEAEYVRKNLGPFAIGDGLLGRFPEETLKACKSWVTSENENVRWNTAMIFTAATARQFKKQGNIILRDLVQDENPFVMKAAQKALKNISQ